MCFFDQDFGFISIRVNITYAPIPTRHSHGCRNARPTVTHRIVFGCSRVSHNELCVKQYTERVRAVKTVVRYPNVQLPDLVKTVFALKIIEFYSGHRSASSVAENIEQQNENNILMKIGVYRSCAY